MESRLSLRCLGEPVLSGPDGEPIRFKVRKHLALLVFLAVEARSRHHRDHLAELLWANLPDGDNRHSLATALSMIRSVAGQECLEADRDHVRFNRSQLRERMSQPPVLDLTLVVAGLPVLAAVAGWLGAGREPPLVSRTPID